MQKRVLLNLVPRLLHKREEPGNEVGTAVGFCGLLNFTVIFFSFLGKYFLRTQKIF
jgi:hypothetical protein